MSWWPDLVVNSTSRKCFKVSRISEGPVEIGSKMLKVPGYTFYVQFFNTQAPQESLLHVTSEANAYGAVFLEWLNGKMDSYTLRNNTEYFIYLKVKEFRHLKDLCQEQSYYQCLASKLQKGQSGDLCAPLTLPTVSQFEDHKGCESYGCKDCESEMETLESLYLDEDVCRGDKDNSCVIKEYTVEDLRNSRRVADLNGFRFTLVMKPPKSSRVTKNLAYLEIFTEYYLLDGYALIGTIGGTLGLMIGFSFMGSITSLTDFVISMKSKNGESKKDGKEQESTRRSKRKHKVENKK